MLFQCMFERAPPHEYPLKYSLNRMYVIEYIYIYIHTYIYVCLCKGMLNKYKMEETNIYIEIINQS